jgi:asparagine synthetase B (glutamine-hydrolysing)
MANIAPVVRFVAYLPDEQESEAQDRVARRLPGLGLELLDTTRYVIAVAAAGPWAGGGRPDGLLDVFPGTAVSPRLTAAGFDGLTRMADLHAKAEDVAQCYNLLHLKPAAFRLESDALGVKPVYVARARGGHVLGSRIADLLALFPELAQPADAVGLYELLCFWHPLAGRTLHHKIRRAGPGACYRWTPGAGLAADRDRALQSVPMTPYRFVDETIEAIRDTTAQSLRAKTANTAQPLWMALSGGFDSRLMAALARELGLSVRTLSFGLAHNEEWLSARAVAQALGLSFERVPYPPDNTFDHIAEHLEATEGTADPAALSIMPLLGVACPPGTTLLHGFCGDLQAGSHIHRFTASDYASHAALAEAVMRRYYASTRPELQRLFSPAIDLDAVRQDMLAGLRADCPPHEAYLLWYLENRNRRYVGAQFALLGGHFDMVLPFYDRRLFNLWHALPPVGLTNRVVFRQLLARYYPALARIAHPEEPAAIIPNLRDQLGRFARSLPRVALTRAVGEQRARELLLHFHRHGDILSLSTLSAPRQRARMLARVDELRPALKEVLGLELTPGYEMVLTAHLQTLRSLFFAAEYAQRQLRGS